MVGRIGELNGIIKALWGKYYQGFYAHPENGKKVLTKNYRSLTAVQCDEGLFSGMNNQGGDPIFLDFKLSQFDSELVWSR